MTVYDPVRGKNALDKMLPHLEEVPEKSLTRRLGSDLQRSAIHALGVAEFCAEDKIREQFESLPAEIFDITHLDRLADLAWGAWYIRTTVLSASAQEEGTMLPADLIDRSTERKQRMLRVLEYYLSDHETAGPEIESIRRGTGYRDQASDLTRLAALYENHESVVRKDTVYYRPTEVADARSDAAEILRHLAGDTDATVATWLDRQSRIWVLLRQSYDEVAAAGRFLFRHDSRRERFNSVVAAGRRPPRPAGKSDGDTEPVADPVASLDDEASQSE